MKNINLKNNGVYFFLGEHSTDKINFLENIIEKNNIKNNCIFDIHDIRRFILGDHYTYDLEDNEIYQISYSFEDFSVIETLLNIIKMRSKQGLFTIVDVEVLTDKQSKKLIYYFNQENIKYDFFNFTLNQELYNKDINDKCSINIKNFELEHSNIDVIGDIHGLYDEFVEFIKQLGYKVENYNITHESNRKILFLGDIVDRGQQSIEMIKLVYNSVKFHGHYAIIGNHENKLLQFKKHYERFKNIQAFNNASSETIIELLKLEESEMNEYLNFIEELPHYYTYKNLAFTHGNLDYFEPTSVIKSKMMYGAGKHTDTDRKYQILFEKGLNKYTLIRGHYIQEEDFENVFSLEKEQAFNGHLALLHLDDFIKDNKTISNIESFKKNTKMFKTDFDFDQHSEKFHFVKKLEEYYSQKLLFREQTKNKFLTLYKYSNKFDNANLLSFDHELSESNGIVFDFSGNILVSPIKRMFNYNSLPNKNIYLKQKYIVREKINGVNFNIGYNPINDNLIFSTSKYIYDNKIKYIIDFLSKDFKQKIKNYIMDNNVSLSFSYNAEDKKLYLLNVKTNKINYKEHTEEQMDFIVSIWGLNNISRPYWSEMELDEVITSVKKNKNSFIVKSSINEEYLFYIDSLYSELHRFLKYLPREDRVSLLNYKTPKVNTEDKKLFCNFLLNKGYNKNIMFLKEYELNNILKNYFKN
jgi:hypothetical protein